MALGNDAYQSAYAKADEASKLLRLEQTLNAKTKKDEAPVFADDDSDLHKSLERARRLAIKKKEEEATSSPQAIATLLLVNKFLIYSSSTSRIVCPVDMGASWLHGGSSSTVQEQGLTSSSMYMRRLNRKSIELTVMRMSEDKQDLFFWCQLCKNI
ncbi:hypothetical protein K1719_044403 [Acacia pycnantha]|nr:hypothetical protein K1719_044403 [Acacia pycnantha]